MPLPQMLQEYVMVYCTSRGLSSIGELSLADISRSVVGPDPHNAADFDSLKKDMMPVPVIWVFLVLAAVHYLVSLLVWYSYNVITTVIIVASTKISVRAAAMARGHEDSQRVRLERFSQKLRVIGAFRAAGNGRLRVRTGSVAQTRETLDAMNAGVEQAIGAAPGRLRRRDTLRPVPIPTFRQAPLTTLWYRFARLPCFRGFIAYLYMAIPRWYLSQVIDWLLSGQPRDFQLGYGSTSIVLASMFAGGFAIWTHYCITKSSNQKILKHFPKGKEVLTELWPITALWQVFEHLPCSLSLSLSRFWGLRDLAYHPHTWNTLGEAKEQQKLAQFAVVLVLYGLVTAVFSVPATMLVRRVYASMLSDDDLAIVPFHRGKRTDTHNYDERTKLHKPGLAVSEAWATITIPQYLRVLGIYFQYFAVNQLIQLAYWSANWKLQQVFEIDQYVSTRVPYSPIGIILPYELRNGTFKRALPIPAHSEL